MANEYRLIDANALFNNLADYWGIPKDWDGRIHQICDDALSTIENFPTVDAVEVPCRCKECKYWKHFDHLGCTEFVKVCTLAYYMIGENGYCLYGERMEGE